MSKERFEDTFKKLETIVTKLENGDLPLEESMKLFEEGTRLSKICSQRLTEVQKKVELLLKSEDGGFQAQPFLFEEEKE
ncbi:MAG: exodeoxyribonuclease VII small subunit [Desulfobacca sp.]|nr:exodeoxyribonuclease VII small subunit [Desulfobacca sp.]